MLNFRLIHLPAFLVFATCIALAIHGPITQLAHYHEFADHSTLWGLPHAGDVLSNMGFALVALWGMVRLWPQRAHHALSPGRYGYGLFLLSLLLTALGSSYYHLAPDNTRLLWDRLPIAWATAVLLAGVRAETRSGSNAGRDIILLMAFATFGVAWWSFTDHYGVGDLRPYLMLQGLALVLIPLWQAAYQAPWSDRCAFGLALLLYVAAKLAELHDADLQAILGFISGHTLKHLLATAAAFTLTARLIRRTRPDQAKAAEHLAPSRASRIAFD
ncbi:hypothetical protein [Undibacterium terreum]|uniref:hypothetical protein n=1 Tax=Undibacterium terreum TaxID=1224302 RepID=UPI00166D744C|nr:hypothetical protein [Undibacterium terreum]